MQSEEFNWPAKIRRFLLSEDGPTAIEYALVAALIAAACVLAVETFGGATAASLESSSQSLEKALKQ